jgi:hypothetical protein
VGLGLNSWTSEYETEEPATGPQWLVMILVYVIINRQLNSFRVSLLTGTDYL